MYRSDITGRSYSKADFLTMLEKRMRKHLRMQELVTDGGSYRVPSDTLAANYVRHVLNHIFHERIHWSEDGTALDTRTLDEWISEQLTAVMSAQELPRTKQPRPLLVVSTAELLQATELLGITGRPPQETHSFIAQLHELYPQTKSSFLKSFLYIEELENLSKES